MGDKQEICKIIFRIRTLLIGNIGNNQDTSASVIHPFRMNDKNERSKKKGLQPMKGYPIKQVLSYFNINFKVDNYLQVLESIPDPIGKTPNSLPIFNCKEYANNVTLTFLQLPGSHHHPLLCNERNQMNPIHQRPRQVHHVEFLLQHNIFNHNGRVTYVNPY